ncbi:type VI secretion system baseplate subunit TssF [Salmonella enterica subsp. enterica serovar Dublin]|uniref:Type VI secretion system baseplate subunit TssF n=9 Tax=Salmonella enterica TaxID=28901 RepID=A0A3Z2MYM2_SALET|nr:type VI secretion system baseplate subunit TssF [Salmonella enterica]AYB08659.1 type VI secretion system baseplate subunit TssF [Salmonella enterica subsp. enterica serovar Dublin]EAW2028012.1 type VI secretion system baseplate subunit TssF [Salmonella enterica subsp. enterica]ECA3049295.1 type VI secretion system baseplate subunit TssF [Salmonella enterica subsp. enterica serovar Rostock]ECG8143099.1 type VI secretion system baseplate subunit TssF [Salmonella enterica subsp. enterica serova
MDPRLLEYYNRELSYLRETGAEFATLHPKIAARLGMQGTDIADPYVERMIEAFSFLSARTQLKIDAEFPRFTQRLLEVVSPNYVTPTPSMAVVKLYPDTQEGDLAKGVTVPRDTAFVSPIPEGENTACQFRSSQDVTLWPLSIEEVRLTAAPPDMPALHRYLPPNIHVAGALRITLRTFGELTFSDLAGPARLPFYLCGEERIASHLFELLHTSAVATLAGEPGHFDGELNVNLQHPVAHEGLEPGQGLLPLAWNVFHGHNLLHEFFACPERFYFFTPTGLSAGLQKVQGNVAEIVILLNRLPPDWLIHQTDAAQFSLFCTPVINLFPRTTTRIEVTHSVTEQHLVVDRTRPLDYEVFSVQEVEGLEAETTRKMIFRPLYHTRNNDEGNHGRYFSLRREPRRSSENARRYGTRPPYTGSEVFLSLVDQHEAPYPENLRHITVTAMVTNRDLPCLIPRNGRDDLTVDAAIPVAGVGLIRPPRPPQPPLAEREMAWRLIRQLSFNYLPLADLDHRTGGQALRDLLNLFIPAHDSPQSRQVRSLPGSGLLVYGRGVSCELTVDEEGFSGISPYLFGLVLEHYIARHVSINTFSQMTLHSMQRGPGRSEPGNGGAYDRRSRPGAENPLALRIPEPDAARGCPAL